MKKTVIILIALFPFVGLAQSSSTKDLSFLIGNWEVERTYSPTTDEKRTLIGTLSCIWSLDSAFIQCTYSLQGLERKQAFDLVFFNYNTIYQEYESAWLSSTWPIKVIMKGKKLESDRSISFLYYSEFPIQENLVEYVKSEWFITFNKSSFSRKTFIRTSKDRDDEWFHHMTEHNTSNN